MTLYYSLVFFILVSEMVAFLLLVAPFPASYRHKIIHAIGQNPFVSQISLSLKFTFVFILVLFIDSVNRTWRVQEDMEKASNMPLQGIQGDRSDILARKFYAQRNMYLCGFTLFLSLILNRTYSLVKQLSAQTNTTKKVAGGSSVEATEVKELKKKLADKERDFDVLKKQSDSLAEEYNRLSDEVHAKSPPVNKKTV